MRKTDWIFLGAGAVGVFLLWRAFKSGWFNPTSDKNLAYQTMNQITQAITGDANVSFGSWLYDVFHPAPKALATVYYMTLFPDGTKHSVPSDTINYRGEFTWVSPSGAKPYGDQRFRLATDAKTGARIAMAV